MAKIILNLNGNLQGEIELAKDRMTIGRKAENDIPIDNKAVSGLHALILSVLDESIIEDLGSTNGTYINGKLVKKQTLKHDDIIGIGKHELKFINEHANDNEEYEETLLNSNDAQNTSFPDDKDTENPSRAAETSTPDIMNMPNGKLHILNGPIAGKELILSKALVTLGKPGIQIAVISRRPQGYFLTHIEGNKDGEQVFPEVNGDSIGAKAYTLKNNDILELAGIKMEFTLES